MTKEEAIKIVKDLYDKSLFLKKDKEAVRTLIPEVEESEDERIRKEMIALFKGQIHSTSAEDNKKYVAWLEKQGEQSKKHDVCDNCDQQGSCVSPCPMKLIEKQGEQKLAPVLDIEIPFGARDSELLEESIAIPKGCYATIEGNRVVIKRGEQKPNYCHHEVDLSGCSEEYRKAYYDGWNNCNQQHAQLDTEQKPTWSEEDELHIRELESLVKQEWAIAECENDKDKIHKMSDLSFFLKTLKPHQNDTKE